MESNKKKIYFASDFHLGFDTKHQTSIEREKVIVDWLTSIENDVEELYLLGDIFDYWFEYGSVIPKGFSCFLSKIKTFRNANIPIYFFTGNHDLWMKSYFEDEYGIPIIRNPMSKIIKEKQFLLGHGDGLGPGDRKYKLMKKVFLNPLNQWLFARLHPNLAMGMMKYFSKRSRLKEKEPIKFLGEENEWLIQYGNEYLGKKEVDFMIFGHRHLPIDFKFPNYACRYINLGEWLEQRSYAVFDGNELQIQFYQNEQGTIHP